MAPKKKSGGGGGGQAIDEPWYKDTASVSAHFKVSVEQGLSDAQVSAQRERYGLNELPADEGTPFWKLVLKQFDDKLVKILLLAAIISFVLALFEEHSDSLHAYVEPIVIFLILIANATVGVLQETNAEKAIEALKQYEASEVRVVRDGKHKNVPSKEIVPGDVVEVSTGENIPADVRCVEIVSTTFRVDQATLTGESVSVQKETEVVTKKDVTIQDKRNMLFSGTNVALGKARGIVCVTGASTEFGKIKATLTETEETVSPLQKKLDEFGDTLSNVITVICILVWVINIGKFNDPIHGSVLRGAVYYFKIAVALAVAAIPEGLPAVVTTCLALGTMKMAAKNAIVRSLPAVETLGCCTVICSDKTGTLTTNMMSVQKVVLCPSTTALDTFAVEGTSFAPSGAISLNGKRVAEPAKNSGLVELCKAASLANGSSVCWNAEKSVYEKIGEPTEVALKVLTEKVGDPTDGKLGLDALDEAHRCTAVCAHWDALYEKRVTLDFSRDRKSMSVVCAGPDKKNHLFCKGAPEGVLARCTHVRLSDGKRVPLDDKLRKLLNDKIDELATQALRCLGMATIDDFGAVDLKAFEPESFAKHETGMTWLGIGAMLDPPRAEVRDAIATCRRAGIRVVVITGDNIATAQSICRKIGIFGADENLEGKSYTGREFSALNDKQKAAAVKKASLFARTEPTHKSELVDLLQKKHGEVAAMTGDGVNDAPALKKADIGIAMGTGTSVAKGCSEMVLADDNFATIVVAIEEGRAIYNNTKQFIRYLISSNIGEVVCIFLTAAVGIPEVLVPVQLLWVNLVTDGLPATALGFNKADSDIMKRPPRNQQERIINGWMFIRYLLVGAYIGVATVAGFVYWFMYFETGPHLTFAELSSFTMCQGEVRKGVSCEIFEQNDAPTIALSVLVTIEMCNALNSLSENQSLLSMPPWTNPWLVLAVITSFALHFLILYTPSMAAIFGVVPIGWPEWKVVLWMSLPVVALDELIKFVSRIMGK